MEIFFTFFHIYFFIFLPNNQQNQNYKQKIMLDKVLTGLLDVAKNEIQEKGLAAALQELLQANFGTISDAIKSQIMAASTEQLQAWMTNAISASSLEDVFKNILKK